MAFYALLSYIEGTAFCCSNVLELELSYELT
jgi:hypothetical protein